MIVDEQFYCTLKTVKSSKHVDISNITYQYKSKFDNVSTLLNQNISNIQMPLLILTTLYEIKLTGIKNLVQR